MLPSLGSPTRGATGSPPVRPEEAPTLGPSRLRIVAAGIGIGALLWLGRLAIELGVASAQPGVALAAERVLSFATIFLGIFVEALPFLLLGVLASAAIRLFVPAEVIARRLPRNRFVAPLVGCALGIVFPVCECGVVPVTRRLLERGATLPLAVGFLLAGTVLNPVVAISTWIAFQGDPIIVFGRLGLVLLVAYTVALVLSLWPEQHSPLVGGAALDCDQEHDELGRPRSVGRIEGLVLTAGDELFEMGRYLVIGALIAAALQTAIPRDALLSIGTGPVASVAALMGLAALLSICSTVDAFVALSFANTFSTGSILAFLVFGPLVDVKGVFLLLAVLRRELVVPLVLVTAQLVFLLGVAISLNVG